VGRGGGGFNRVSRYLVRLFGPRIGPPQSLCLHAKTQTQKADVCNILGSYSGGVRRVDWQIFTDVLKKRSTMT
jgi:hypothetical protein